MQQLKFPDRFDVTVTFDKKDRNRLLDLICVRRTPFGVRLLLIKTKHMDGSCDWLLSGMNATFTNRKIQ